MPHWLKPNAEECKWLLEWDGFLERDIKMPEKIETLYSDILRSYDNSGMYISMFHAAKRLGDKGLESKAIEKEAAKFSLFGFDYGARLFLDLAKKRMDKGTLEDIDIPQIELGVINIISKKLVAHYDNCKELFDKAKGTSALKHVEKLVSDMYAMSRLDSLYHNISSGWPFPFASGTGRNMYYGSDHFIAENLDYLAFVCPRIAGIVENSDLIMEKKILQKVGRMNKLLKKSEVEEQHESEFVSAVQKLIGNAVSNRDLLLGALSDPSRENMAKVLLAAGRAEGPLTKMQCLYLSIGNLKGIAEGGDIQRIEDIIESMQRMAMWKSSDLHSFEHLLAISEPRKSYGRQTNLDRYLKLRRR